MSGSTRPPTWRNSPPGCGSSTSLPTRCDPISSQSRSRQGRRSVTAYVGPGFELRFGGCAEARFGPGGQLAEAAGQGARQHAGLSAEDGVWELRVDVGAGYRVYYAHVGNMVIMLTSGGDKKSQSRDIERAVKLLKDWEKRNGQGTSNPRGSNGRDVPQGPGTGR
ncbi:type II toxin-antitoxin system RelE/ParE family toxin [Thauera aromatica]|uniref:type II toxin-antitoxin system RelE/ParE family toxin n=1 Tax=Thauera aromatica TaxID=59405 RepID=UPI002481FBD8|nr:type II toxin-antitoxin system RelE/ParE family toxin [Thauera aromatica]